MISLVSIVPAAVRDAADAVAERLGWGPRTYTVALAPPGAEAPTHYGCRVHASPQTPAVLASDPATLGVDWGRLTLAEVRAVQEAALVSVEPDGQRPAAAHFRATVTAAGLEPWSAPDVI